MAIRRLLVTLAALLALAGVARAQDQGQLAVAPGPSPRPVGEYDGVTPGEAHDPGHLRGRPGATPAVVTWPGFQPRSDGASRFFLQTTTNVQLEQHAEHGRFVVILHGIRIPDRQTRRTLDTRFFNTPVTRSWLERRGRHDVAFVLELRADVTPTVTTERGPDGYTFVYVSFGAGSYLPAELAAPPPPPNEAQVAPAGDGTTRVADDPSLHTMDDERPPGMQGHGPNP